MMPSKNNKIILCFYKIMIILIVIHCSNELNMDLQIKNKKLNILRKMEEETSIPSPSKSPLLTTINTIIKDVDVNGSAINLHGNETAGNYYIHRGRKSTGLSAGSIVAIIIPCVAALIAVGVLAALCRETPASALDKNTQVNYMMNSSDRFGTPAQEVIVQQPVVKQPMPVVQETTFSQPGVDVQQSQVVV